MALHQLGYPGFLTGNYKMLQNPRELAAIMETRISVFGIEGVGHNPIALPSVDMRASELYQAVWLSRAELTTAIL